MMWACHLALANQFFFNVFGRETCGSKFCFEIAEFRSKVTRVDFAQELLSEIENDPELLKLVITSDESWVYW